MIRVIARILLMLGLLFFAVRWANAAEPRYTPAPRYYGAPLTPSEYERRALQAETYRLQRDQAEDLRRFRNDLEDRDHQQKMEGFRERFRGEDRR
jgi:hypothetical protein